MKVVISLLINICFLVCPLDNDVVGQQSNVILKPNEPIERRLKGGDVQGFRINLKANQFMRVIVEQRGVDVVLSLYSPDDNLLEERDRPNSTNGEESLSAEVTIAGEYLLEVSALDEEAEEDKYEIKLETPYTAKAEDKRVKAEKIFQEAMKLRSEDTDLLSQSVKKHEESIVLWHELGDSYAEAMALDNLFFTYKGLLQNERQSKAQAEH